MHHNEEAVRTSDEDKSLRDYGDLRVDDSVWLEVVIAVIAGRGSGTGLEMDTKSTIEPVGLDDDGDEGDDQEGEV